MKIIKPSATLMEHNITPYEFIEKVGRTCYKSENNITIGSAERFVAGLVKSEHMAMLEHETLFMVMSNKFMNDFLREMYWVNEPLTFFNTTHEEGVNILSGSFRSFYDLFNRGASSFTLEHIKKILKVKFPLVFDKFKDAVFYMTYDRDDCFLYTRKDFIDAYSDKPEVLFKHLTHTFLFVCDRGVTHEFVRHRVASFAQESTRYCNYSKDKFGNEITVIEPLFWSSDSVEYYSWKRSCMFSEMMYFELLHSDATPQEARSVLPNSLKTEIIITATEEEWQHIVNLRLLGTTGAPHPQIKEVMTLAMPDLIVASECRVNYGKV